MACPNCDHAMHNLGVEKPPDVAGRQTWWCPRCGTRRTTTLAVAGGVSVTEDETPRWCRRLEPDQPPLPMLTLEHLNNLAQYPTYIDQAKEFLAGIQPDVSEAGEKAAQPKPSWPPPGAF